MFYKQAPFAVTHHVTLALLEGGADYTLSKQRGNSEAMIERHYSKFFAAFYGEGSFGKPN